MSSTNSILIRLLVRDRGLCYYCQRNLVTPNFLKQEVTRDHIIPRHWGGPANSLRNQVVCCRTCNTLKHILERSALELCRYKVVNLRDLCEAFWVAACACSSYTLVQKRTRGRKPKQHRFDRNRVVRMVYALWSALESNGEHIQERLDRRAPSLAATIQIPESSDPPQSKQPSPTG